MTVSSQRRALPRIDLAAQNRVTLDVISGLVLHYLMDLRQPGKLEAARGSADERLETIAGSGHLAERGPVRNRAVRDERRKVLNAVALTIAVFAYEPGGVDFCGTHWCVAPHPRCPRGRTSG